MKFFKSSNKTEFQKRGEVDIALLEAFEKSAPENGLICLKMAHLLAKKICDNNEIGFVELPKEQIDEIKRKYDVSKNILFTANEINSALFNPDRISRNIYITFKDEICRGSTKFKDTYLNSVLLELAQESKTLIDENSLREFRQKDDADTAKRSTQRTNKLDEQQKRFDESFMFANAAINYGPKSKNPLPHAPSHEPLILPSAPTTKLKPRDPNQKDGGSAT